MPAFFQHGVTASPNILQCCNTLGLQLLCGSTASRHGSVGWKQWRQECRTAARDSQQVSPAVLSTWCCGVPGHPTATRDCQCRFRMHAGLGISITLALTVCMTVLWRTLLAWHRRLRSTAAWRTSRLWTAATSPKQGRANALFQVLHWIVLPRVGWQERR